MVPLAEELGVTLNPPSRFYPTRKAHQAALVVEHVAPDEINVITIDSMEPSGRKRKISKTPKFFPI